MGTTQDHEAISGGLHPPAVLIVDDDAALADYVAVCLRTAGCAVSTASNGLEALAKIARDSPDVLLLDLDLPVLNGLQVHAALRNGEQTRDLPVVTMSGTDWPAPADAAGTLAKPLTGDTVVSTVFDVLANARPSDAPLAGLRAIVRLCPSCKRAVSTRYERGNPATSSMTVDPAPCEACR